MRVEEEELKQVCLQKNRGIEDRIVARGENAFVLRFLFFNF